MLRRSFTDHSGQNATSTKEIESLSTLYQESVAKEQVTGSRMKASSYLLHLLSDGRYLCAISVIAAWCSREH